MQDKWLYTTHPKGHKLRDDYTVHERAVYTLKKSRLKEKQSTQQDELNAAFKLFTCKPLVCLLDLSFFFFYCASFQSLIYSLTEWLTLFFLVTGHEHVRGRY